MLNPDSDSAILARFTCRDRIGVFGGTFDPLHLGHLRLAEETAEQLGLVHVLFVPNVLSPFKTDRESADGVHRLAMLRLATADNPKFTVTDRELRRGGVSYTIETLRALRAENTDGPGFVFLTGSDALRDVARWREPEALFQIAEFAVAVRPGVAREECLTELPETWRRRVQFVHMSALDISASDIREKVAQGRSVRYLVPAEVAQYIRRHDLYRRQSEHSGESV